MAFTTYRTWVASEVITAALLNAQIRDNGNIWKAHFNDDGTKNFLYASRVTSDFVKNANTTYGDVTGLSFPIAASEVWTFNGALYLTSNVSADIKIDITVPSGAVGRFGTAQNTSASNTKAYGGSGFGVGTIGSDETFLLSGVVVNSTTAGTVQVQAAQLASHASNTTIYTNSYITAVRTS